MKSKDTGTTPLNIMCLLLSVLLLLLAIIYVWRPVEKYITRDAVAYPWGNSYTDSVWASGPVSPDVLCLSGGYFRANSADKILYLTTDVGDSTEYSIQFINNVIAEGVPLTVFITGVAIENHPDLVKKIASLDVQIGNHTWSHEKVQTGTDPQKVLEDIHQMEQEFYELTGRKMDKVVRLPEGIFSLEVLKALYKEGYVTVFWGTAYADWDVENQPTYEDAWNVLNERTRCGNVVLLHARSKCNADNVRQFIANWTQDGYTFEPLQHCIDSWQY